MHGASGTWVVLMAAPMQLLGASFCVDCLYGGSLVLPHDEVRRCLRNVCSYPPSYACGPLSTILFQRSIVAEQRMHPTNGSLRLRCGA